MTAPFTPSTGSASISTTEFSLPSNSTTRVAQTTANRLSGHIDLSNMVAGDQYRIRVYDKVNGSAQLVLFEAWVTGAQTGAYPLPVRSVNEGWDVTLLLISASARTIGWSLKLDVADVNAATAGATAVTSIQAGLATAATALSTVQWTNARAGFVDNLNVGGNVASSAEVVAIQNNTRVVRVVPDVIERPDSGTTTYRVEVLLYDGVGNMEVPDSAPTISLVNQAGTDLSARLDSTTMASVSAGRYRAVYTAAVADALEQLVWTFSVIEGGATRLYGNTTTIVDTTAVDFTNADRTLLTTLASDLNTTRVTKIDQLDAAMTSRAPAATALTTATWTNARAAKIDNADTTTSSRAAISDVTTVGAAVAAVQADTSNIKTRLPTALDGSGNIKAGVQSLAGAAITSISDAVLGATVVAGFTVAGTLRAVLSFAVGKLSGVTGGTYRYRDPADTKDVITGTVTADGRSSVTVDPS